LRPVDKKIAKFENLLPLSLSVRRGRGNRQRRVDNSFKVWSKRRNVIR
jgi:hypothetical protein